MILLVLSGGLARYSRLERDGWPNKSSISLIMLLTEPLDSINKQLKEHFGIDTFTGMPIWRIVFSEDQYEKRLGTYDDFSDGGIYLRTVTEVREAPKYKQWIHEKYILERLVVVPVQQEDTLPTSKVSYEPIWVFEDRHGNYLPPKWEASEAIIKTIYAVQYGTHDLARYKDPIQSHEDAVEAQSVRVSKIKEELFGEETLISDALTRQEAIIVPSKFFGE